LYNELLNKISPEIELSISSPSGKDRLAPVPILHTYIPSIQDNPPTYSSSPFLSYKSLSPSPTLGSKKSIVEIEENDNVDSNIEMQTLSSQQSLQPTL